MNNSLHNISLGDFILLLDNEKSLQFSYGLIYGVVKGLNYADYLAKKNHNVDELIRINPNYGPFPIDVYAISILLKDFAYKIEKPFDIPIEYAINHVIYLNK